MNIRPIRNDEDHSAALAEIERLWGAEPASDDEAVLDALVTLVDAYEAKRWPMPQSTPLEILRYATSDMGHTQAELAHIIGSRSRASEILTGKREMTVEQIRKISRAWGISPALLVGTDETVGAAAA